MSKRNYIEYDYNYPESLMNQIKVNKKAEIKPNTLNYFNLHKNNNNINANNNYYYNIDKKTKTQKNKIPLSLNKKNMKKVSEEKKKNNVKNINRETIKKTINIFSPENRIKDVNIIEELQNNKYLRPMLCASNISNKLQKCQIEEPIKNIYPLSLKNYINRNMELPFEKSESPKKRNYNDVSDENTINYYNLNNDTNKRTLLKKANNYFSPNYEKSSLGEKKNNSSFIDKDSSFKLSKYLSRYSINSIKKFPATQLRMQNKKSFYSEERKEKEKNDNNNLDKKEVYSNNSSALNSSINNKLRNKNNIKYLEKNNTLEIKNKNNSKDNKLLQIYKSKLVEEFIIVLNKFIGKYLNKNRMIFFKNFMLYKKESKSKNKIYCKKKNDKYIKKQQITSNNKKNKLILNIQKYKDKEKNKAKVTTDTSTNFNLNNKSFSNDIKSSSLSNNILSNLFINNNRINYNQSSSFLFSEQKHKNNSQSPEDSLLKHPIPQIKTKTIIYKKLNSGSPNRSFKDTKKDGFVYKKKSLNNDNNYINKNNNIDINNFYSNNNDNKYNSSINNNKKGKIIDIDINLGKPIKIINDHSPLEELFLENNEPLLFKLNTISSKFINKNKKKNKAKSGSHNKIKLPLASKRFAEEDEKEYEFINNLYVDSYNPYSTTKEYKSNNIINLKTENNINEFNINNINGNFDDDNREIVIEDNKLYIRNKICNFNNNNNNEKFKSLIIEKNIPSLIPNYKKNEIRNKKEYIPLDKKTTKKKDNKLYINCTKFFISILNRFIKKKIFIMINKYKKNKNSKYRK